MPGALIPGRLRLRAARGGHDVTESQSLERTVSWRIAAALLAVCLLALGGWVFPQDKPAAARLGMPVPVRAR
jgi:hypothetical protein